MPRKTRVIYGSIENKVKFAKLLRTRSTYAEKLLWERLRKDKIGYKFRRQYLVVGYIVDFACPKTKIMIELDGGCHEGRELYDKQRTERIEKLGFRVFRFANDDIIDNTDAVVLKIEQLCIASGYPQHYSANGWEM